MSGGVRRSSESVVVCDFSSVVHARVASRGLAWESFVAVVEEAEVLLAGVSEDW